MRTSYITWVNSARHPTIQNSKRPSLVCGSPMSTVNKRIRTNNDRLLKVSLLPNLNIDPHQLKNKGVKRSVEDSRISLVFYLDLTPPWQQVKFRRPPNAVIIIRHAVQIYHFLCFDLAWEILEVFLPQEAMDASLRILCDFRHCSLGNNYKSGILTLNFLRFPLQI